TADGLELLGRVAGAEARGCSLALPDFLEEPSSRDGRGRWWLAPPRSERALVDTRVFFELFLPVASPAPTAAELFAQPSRPFGSADSFRGEHDVDLSARHVERAVHDGLGGHVEIGE